MTQVNHFWSKPAPNVPPRSLNDDDDVVALDNTAFRQNDEWQAEFVISVYSKLDAERLRERAVRMLNLLPARITPENGLLERIGERLRFFAAVPRSGVNVQLKGGNDMEFEVGPTLENGIMSVLKNLSIAKDWEAPGTSMDFKVIGPQPDLPQHNLQTRLSEEKGWGIISGSCQNPL